MDHEVQGEGGGVVPVLGRKEDRSQMADRLRLYLIEQIMALPNDVKDWPEWAKTGCKQRVYQDPLQSMKDKVELVGFVPQVGDTKSVRMARMRSERMEELLSMIEREGQGTICTMMGVETDELESLIREANHARKHPRVIQGEYGVAIPSNHHVALKYPLCSPFKKDGKVYYVVGYSADGITSVISGLLVRESMPDHTMGSMDRIRIDDIPEQKPASVEDLPE